MTVALLQVSLFSEEFGLDLPHSVAIRGVPAKHTVLGPELQGHQEERDSPALF